GLQFDERLRQLKQRCRARRIVARAVKNLVAFQSRVLSQMIPMRGIEEIFVPQLRIGAIEFGDHVLRGHLTKRVLESEAGLGPERHGSEVSRTRFVRWPRR